MARRVVLWRILRRMLRIVECETSLFWIEGGGGSVEQELGENWHSRDRIEPDGSRGGVGSRLRPPDPPKFWCS